MASEFTRKIQRIKNILTFNSILADDGDILLTKSGEVYTQVNGKVKQLSNPNYGAGNVNKILSVSGTGEVVPIVMPSEYIVKNVNFDDISVVAKTATKYVGNWATNGATIKGMPTTSSNWDYIQIMSHADGAGIIKIYDYSKHLSYTGFIDKSLITWYQNNITIDNQSTTPTTPDAGK